MTILSTSVGGASIVTVLPDIDTILRLSCEGVAVTSVEPLADMVCFEIRLP